MAKTSPQNACPNSDKRTFLSTYLFVCVRMCTYVYVCVRMCTYVYVLPVVLGTKVQIWTDCVPSAAFNEQLISLGSWMAFFRQPVHTGTGSHQALCQQQACAQCMQHWGGV